MEGQEGVRRRRKSSRKSVHVDGGRRGSHGSSASSVWSRASSEDLSKNARREMAAWLSVESELYVRGRTAEAFCQDLEDSIVLCGVLYQLGWLNDCSARLEVLRRLESDQTREVTKSEKKVYLNDFLDNLAEAVQMDHPYADTFGGISADNLDTIILPFLLEFKDVVEEAAGPAEEDQIDELLHKPAKKKMKEKIHKLVRREIGGHTKGRSPSRSRSEPLVDEDVDEALSSLFGLVIFLVVMLAIAALVFDVIGITNIGIAIKLGLRKAPVPQQDITWYADLKRTW